MTKESVGVFFRERERERERESLTQNDADLAVFTANLFEKAKKKTKNCFIFHFLSLGEEGEGGMSLGLNQAIKKVGVNFLSLRAFFLSFFSVSFSAFRCFLRLRLSNILNSNIPNNCFKTCDETNIVRERERERERVFETIDFSRTFF